MGCGTDCAASVPVDRPLRAAATGGWTQIAVPLVCLGKGGADMSRIDRPLAIRTDGALDLTISGIRLTQTAKDKIAC
ncbi:putative glycoside hydrolase [Sphingomonas sp. Leaf33]|uniref:putative glycoside hydrolase n=1 Tax=Sphingomonas sp. Leaf33 TaxID=1736215 RepID=UPI001F281FA0|nr:putative glycoside hydrolase [Sphingomonas sp. Leaf33]